jgi:hypothetical protein
VVKGILHSQQAEMQAVLEAVGEELLWVRQPGMIKGRVLVISDSCTLQRVRK